MVKNTPSNPIITKFPNHPWLVCDTSLIISKWAAVVAEAIMFSWPGAGCPAIRKHAVGGVTTQDQYHHRD